MRVSPRNWSRPAIVVALSIIAIALFDWLAGRLGGSVDNTNPDEVQRALEFLAAMLGIPPLLGFAAAALCGKSLRTQIASGMAVGLLVSIGFHVLWYSFRHDTWPHDEPLAVVFQCVLWTSLAAAGGASRSIFHP